MPDVTMSVTRKTLLGTKEDLPLMCKKPDGKTNKYPLSLR